MYQIEDRLLITDQGTLSFETTIGEVLESNGMVIVRVELASLKLDINNVYGVRDGQILWQVQALADYNPRLADSLLSQWEPYTRIKIYEKDPTLILGTSCGGFRYLIDPMSGKIVGEESWVK